MKFRWDKKYLYWGITAFLVILASILSYYFIFHSNKITVGIGKILSISMPIIDGLVLAYLLNPILNAIEQKIIVKLYTRFSKVNLEKEKRRIRNFSLLITMLLFVIFIYGFFSLVIPQIILSIQSIVLQFPIYVNNLESWLGTLLADNAKIEEVATDLLNRYSSDINTWLNNTVIPQINVVIREVSLSMIGIAKFLWNFIIGFIISIYLLGSKETFAGQAKKIIYAIFETETANNIIFDIRSIDNTFGKYISGKLIDSLIIGILCFIGMSILDMPYVVLISVIVGITNIIPFFGPYLGAIPSAILILMINPIQAIYFAIFILILQQFDGNVLGPKILGDSTGLSSFWVIFSITLFGGFFGILGMAVGVPIFAIIYKGFKRYIHKMLVKKDLPDDTELFLKAEKLDSNKKFIPFEAEEKKPNKLKNKLSNIIKNDKEEK